MTDFYVILGDSFLKYNFRSKTLPDIHGPQVVGDGLAEKKPIDFFHKMFPDVLYENIAKETNRYASEVIESKVLGPKSRFLKWTETNAQEIQAFLGLRIAMGLCTKPTIEDYWSETWLTNTPNFAQVMTRNRYKLLSSFLHFANNSARLERNDPEFDALFKVRPVLKEVLPAWQDSYIPGRNLSIDESMVSFRGKIFFRQYIQSKHHRFGMKVFVLACSSTSYTYKWDVYTGGMYQYDRQVGQVYSVVNKLSENIPEGHILFLDSFYTSPKLCKDLYDHGLGVCGTVGQHRKDMPEALKDRTVKLKEGDMPIFRYKSPVLARLFYDRKAIRLLSTVHSQEVFTKEITVSQAQKGKYPSGKRIVHKPMMVQDYNRYMGGVDRADQMCSYHPFPHKCIKWYIRLFNHVVELALINARICYNLTHAKKLSSESFRKTIADEMVRPYVETRIPKQAEVQVPTEMRGVPARLLGKHFMAQFGKSKPDCIVCSDRKAKKRKQTFYYCKSCPDKPALCTLPCFERYHTLYKYK